MLWSHFHLHFIFQNYGMNYEAESMKKASVSTDDPSNVASV